MKITKKSTLVLVLLLTINLGFSQSRIGFKLDEIVKEWSGYEVKSLGKNHAPGFHLYVKLDIGDVAYYTDEDSFCVKTLVIPKNEEMWKALKDSYNEDYVVINDKSWLVCFDDTKTANLIEIIDDKSDVLFKLRGSYIKTIETKY
jgi:hypothetical protein